MHMHMYALPGRRCKITKRIIRCVQFAPRAPQRVPVVP